MSRFGEGAGDRLVGDSAFLRRCLACSMVSTTRLGKSGVTPDTPETIGAGV